MKIRPERILATTDFSESAQIGLRLAGSLAGSFGAKLFLLNVIPEKELEYISEAEFPKKPVDIIANEQKERLVQHFEEVLKPEERERVKLQPRVRFGEPAKEIIKISEELEADLVVMATHGRTGLRHLLAGSVAEEVVRNAACPVLTIRPREKT
ncbi:MAG: universal stress protein [Thermodesulfobacteriota bacterium]